MEKVRNRIFEMFSLSNSFLGSISLNTFVEVDRFRWNRVLRNRKYSAATIFAFLTQQF